MKNNNKEILKISKFLFENSDDLISISDESGNFFYLNPSAKKALNIDDNLSEVIYNCSVYFNCRNLEKIPQFCPVKNLTGIRGEFSTKINIWINSIPYELRCTPIYDDNLHLVYIFHIAKDVSEAYRQKQELKQINFVLKIVRNINQMIYLERNPQKILEKSASILCEYSDYQYILIVPSKVLGIKSNFIEYASTKFSNSKIISVKLREKILKYINYEESNKPKSNQYYYSATEFNGNQYNILIIKLSHFGLFFGYLTILTDLGRQLIQEEIDLLIEMANDIAFALNFSLFELEKLKIETEWREKERFYFTLMQNLPGFVYRCRNDRYWTMEYLSDQFYKITGYKPEEVIGNKNLSFNDLIHPSHQERLWVKWQDILHKKEIFQDEYPIICKDKQIRWVFEQGCGVFDENGKLLYLEGYIVDVTERKLIEEDLRASERRYRTLFESIQDAVFLILGDTFVDCNYATFKMFECTRKDIIGRSPYDFSPQYQPDGELSYKKATSYIRKAHNGEFLCFEWKHRTLKGKLFDAEVTLSRFFVGSTPYLLGIVRNISEIKQKYKELSELAQALTSIGEAITITDLNNNLIFVNKAFEKIYGYTSDEVIGKHISFLKEPNYDPTDLEKMIHELNEKKFWRGELPNRKKDGTIFPIQLTASLLTDKDGKAYGYIGVASDLTEVKKLQSEFLQANAKLNSILNSFEDIVYICDMSNIFIEVFGKWISKWGLDKTSIVGKTILEVFGNESSKIHLEMHSKCLNELVSFSYDWEYSMGDKIVYYQTMISPYFDNTGEVIGVVGVVRDITKFKEIQDQLQILYLLIEQSPISVVILEADGKISYINKTTTKIFGYEKDKLIGQNIKVLSPLFPNQEFFETCVNVSKTKESCTTEFTIQKNNGELICVSFNVFAVSDQVGNIINLVIIAEDITKRKQLLIELTKGKEYAEELNALKNYLITNFSHEFRTPLNGVLGYSQLLILEQKDNEVKDIAEKIYLSGQRLLTTINLLFDYSKVETGLFKIQVRTFDFVDMVKEITCFYSKYFSEKNISLKIESETDSLEMNSDEAMVRTIVTNLISNAFKFTNQGEVKIVIKITTKDGKNWVEFTLIDTGIGIPNEHINHIWKAFYQASQGLSREYEGSGIGLTVTKKFVEILGGEITCWSQVNVGSKFSVLLPIRVDIETK